VQIFSDVRQIEVHTAETLGFCPSHLEVETYLGKFKVYKTPGNYQILKELFQAGGGEVMTASLFPFGIMRSCLINRRSLFVPVPKRLIKLTVTIIIVHQCYQLHTTLYPVCPSEAKVYIQFSGFPHNKSNTGKIFCIWH
jgi:hypothetical protein